MDEATILRGAFGVTAGANALLDRLLGRVKSFTEREEREPTSFRMNLGEPSLLVVCARRPSKEAASLGRLLEKIESIWFYLEADSADHNLFFNGEAAPPIGDAQLDGTPFEGARVCWFLEEVPWDRYWFVVDNEPDAARCFEFDGGLHEEVVRGPIEELVLSRILELIEKYE